MSTLHQGFPDLANTTHLEFAQTLPKISLQQNSAEHGLYQRMAKHDVDKSSMNVATGNSQIMLQPKERQNWAGHKIASEITRPYTAPRSLKNIKLQRNRITKYCTTM
jgi:hypothetical protein